MHSVAISYRDVLCPYVDFVQQDTDATLIKEPYVQSEDDDDICLIDDERVGITAENFPRLRIVSGSAKVPVTDLSESFSRVIKASDDLTAYIDSNVSAGRDMVIIAMPYGHDSTLNWMIDDPSQAVLSEDRPALAAE